jgi:hypothetical protein
MSPGRVASVLLIALFNSANHMDLRLCETRTRPMMDENDDPNISTRSEAVVRTAYEARDSAIRKVEEKISGRCAALNDRLHALNFIIGPLVC